LLALSREVSRGPRDVTGDASWHLSGNAGAQVSRTGIVEAAPGNNVGDGGRVDDVRLDVDYQSQTAHSIVRLSRNGPGQLLTIVRGRVFAEDDGSLHPVAAVRLEVISGPDAGKSATTERDGGYELPGLVPGTLELRATKSGYESTVLTVSIQPGDAIVSVLMRTPIHRDGGAHEVIRPALGARCAPQPCRRSARSFASGASSASVRQVLQVPHLSQEGHDPAAG
jgi:hypothetical protein